MARYTGPKCRYCRAERAKLFLKGSRCLSAKCPMNNPAECGLPGKDPKARAKKPTDYALMLRAKQKLKRIYCMLEKQFKLTFDEANRMPGKTGDNLLITVERRLDNVVYRMGFAMTRRQARQLVSHAHFTVNGKKVNIPSYLVRVGDVIEVKESSRSSVAFKRLTAEDAPLVTVPTWLERDKNALKGTVTRLPARDDIDMPIEEHLIVELYSK